MFNFKHSFFRVFHWGPLIALSIILSITICTVSVLGQWHNRREAFINAAAAKMRGDPYEDKLRADTIEGTWYSHISPYLLISFLSFSSLTLYYFVTAMFTGPGVVPTNWSPAYVEDRACLQYCQMCENYKPPRSHHCRQCGKCVLKMDHHCPWINNCVGHLNHACFSLFLGSAVLGCLEAAIILTPSIYWAMYRRWYIYYGTGDAPLIFFSLWGLLLNMFVLGLAIGVIVAVGLLFYFQLRSILRNRTGIEDWIMEKAIYRRIDTDMDPFVYPYNLGRWKNLKEVFHSVGGLAKGDGIEWPVVEGCDQYTLTVEQIHQKENKRARSMKFVIRRDYSGSWLPITHGLSVCCRPPCTDEPRIKLREGDVVVVTRWKRHWLYGDCMQDAGDLLHKKHEWSKWERLNKYEVPEGGKPWRHRGWFPRHCGVPLVVGPIPHPNENYDLPPKDQRKIISEPLQYYHRMGKPAAPSTHQREEPAAPSTHQREEPAAPSTHQREEPAAPSTHQREEPAAQSTHQREEPAAQSTHQREEPAAQSTHQREEPTDPSTHQREEPKDEKSTSKNGGVRKRTKR